MRKRCWRGGSGGCLEGLWRSQPNAMGEPTAPHKVCLINNLPNSPLQAASKLSFREAVLIRVTVPGRILTKRLRARLEIWLRRRFKLGLQMFGKNDPGTVRRQGAAYAC